MEMIINKNEKKIIPITKWKMRVTILFLILLFGISTPCITKQSESQEMQIIELPEIKNYIKKDKINLEKFVLIIKGMLLGLFIFGMGMVSAEIQCFLRHCYDDFKESFKFYCVSSFIISLIIVIQYLYKNW